MFPCQYDDFTLNNSNYTPEQLRYENLMKELHRIITIDRDSTESVAQSLFLDPLIPFDQSEVQSSDTNQQFKEFGCYSSDSQTITIQSMNGDQMEFPMLFGEYESKECLGSGGFSSVVHVINTKSKRHYAAKVFPSKITNDPEQSKYILNEIKFLKKIDHPYVIRYNDFFSVINKYGEKYFVIISEYCKNGDLTNYVHNHQIDDSQLKSLIYKICIGLSYLHNSCGISHGDIKSDNILLDDYLNPKFCDFGFASDCKISHGKGFTLQYASPEVLRGEDYNRFMADIWSLGITLYGLKTKRLPFDKELPFEDQILSGNLLLDRDDDNDLQKLVLKCTQMNPEDRPTIKEILGDIYFSTK